MVVTIEDRRVTSLPVELQSMIHVGPYCIACKKTCQQVNICSRCKIATYCSRECQKQDFSRHKTEDNCVAIGNVRRNLQFMEEGFEANGCMIMQEVIIKFGDEEDTWLGRGEPSLMEMMGLMTLGIGQPPPFGADSTNRSIMDVMAGRFFGLNGTAEYINAMLQLSQLAVRVAHRHQTVEAFEEILKISVEVKRLTHAYFEDCVDRELPKVLLKLHRDDDATSFIRYWIKWRSQEPGNLRDPLVLLSEKGEWPFPCEKGAKFLDIVDEIRSAQFVRLPTNEDEMVFPAPYAMVVLTIKLRHLYLYQALKPKAEAFLEVETELPQEIKNRIVSFLTGGATLYEKMRGHANRLMDYIDEAYPHILLGTLFPDMLPPPAPGRDGVDDNQAFDVRGFMNSYGDSIPVTQTLANILNERYGLPVPVEETNFN